LQLSEDPGSVVRPAVAHHAAVTKLTLAYDGRAFAGWARQPGQRSVQEELESAIERILGEPLAVSVAGRTDRGVHAWGQVVSYRHEALDPRRLNALLPSDIAVLASEPAAPEFDARRSARTRTYCYRVLRRAARSPFEQGRALWVPWPIDTAALHACAAALVGRHSFTAFTPTETHHVRFERDVVAARWEERGELLEFWIEADSFMRQMNRALVGTMLEVARGRRSVAEFAALLAGLPRSEGGPTLPPHGLYLAAVSYG
jgi:tRNA pseudouridine38-40 synthase